ncbi:hypothetical protein Ahia01_000438800 [Argonauta hians]
MLVLILLCYLSCLVSAAEVGFLRRWEYKNRLGEVGKCCRCRKNFVIEDVIEECFNKNRNDYTNLPFCKYNGENFPRCPQKFTVCQKNITCDTNEVYSQCKVPFLDNAILTCGDNLNWEGSFRCPGSVEVAGPRQGYYNNKSNIPDGKACGIDTYIAFPCVNLVYMIAMMMAFKLLHNRDKMIYAFIFLSALSLSVIIMPTLFINQFNKSVSKKSRVSVEMYKNCKIILDIVGCIILPLYTFILSWKLNKKHDEKETERCGKRQILSALTNLSKLVILKVVKLFIGLFFLLSAVYLIIYSFVLPVNSSVNLLFVILFIICDLLCLWYLALIWKPQNFENKHEGWIFSGQLLILNLLCQWLQFTEPTNYHDKKSDTYTPNMTIRWTEISMLILYLLCFELILFYELRNNKNKQVTRPEDVELTDSFRTLNNHSSSSSSNRSSNSSERSSSSSIPVGCCCCCFSHGKNKDFGESEEAVYGEGLASGPSSKQDDGAWTAGKVFTQGANNDKVSSKNEELEKLNLHLCQPTSDEDVENIPHRMTSEGDYAADDDYEACVDELYVESECDVSFSENLVVQTC